MYKVFPSVGGDWGSPLSQFCAPHHNLVPPQKFPENNRENNSLLFLNNGLLLKIQPTSQLFSENLHACDIGEAQMCQGRGPLGYNPKGSGVHREPQLPDCISLRP